MMSDDPFLGMRDVTVWAVELRRDRLTAGDRSGSSAIIFPPHSIARCAQNEVELGAALTHAALSAWEVAA
jgi:hypothetical protein